MAAKTPSGATTQEKPINSLPPFAPKPASGPLRFREARTSKLSDRPYDPLGQNPSRRLMRAIDLDQRARHDFDDRYATLFRSDSPDAIVPGTVVAVEVVSSRSRPQPSLFAGLVVAVRRKGIMTHMILRNYLAGTGVELVVPVFSPLVTKIVVLKRMTEAQKLKLRQLSGPPKKVDANGKVDAASLKPGVEENQILWVRERPADSPVSFSTIDTLVLRYRQRQKLEGA
ncbi:hypothetical protein BJ742DRAFT_800617 [Cladochytrium replicatum]|nr:hypothetical protein BJ742DRAFT_800617 [Cladochytrium replicatum]